LGTLLMLNEPNVHAVLGHLLGVHAPGDSDLGAFTAALHHQNLATALGIERLRELGGPWRLGTVVNMRPALPASEAEEDRGAARFYDAVYHRSVLDPLLLGRYPDAVRPLVAAWLREGDEQRLGQGLDLLGVNYYTRVRVRGSDTSLVGFDQLPPDPAAERTAMGDAVDPEGLSAVLRDLGARFPELPLVVTENGASFADPPPIGGMVDDARRVRYLRRHVLAVADAIHAGCDVRGYFPWTLVDNFEWAEGFGRPFGLVQLDTETMERTPKRSFGAYRQIVADHGLSREGGAASEDRGLDGADPTGVL
jgi:beta-glucosidase